MKFDEKYQILKQYYDINHNIEIKQLYKDENNNPLGQWIYYFRKQYKENKLSEYEIKQLEAIGMIWNINLSAHFNKKYEALKEYFIKNGNIDIVKNYKDENNNPLGYWIYYFRKQYKENKLSEYEIKQLETIGMIWNINLSTRFDKKYEALKEYFIKNGNIDIVKNYKDENNNPLGYWIYCFRQQYKKNKLSEYEIKQLETIGMIWNVNLSINFDEKYKVLKQYFIKNENLNIKSKYKDENNNPLGQWIYCFRKQYKENKLSKYEIQQLEAIGMMWNISVDIERKSFKEKYQILEKYYKIHNNLDIPQNYIDENGNKLGIWIRDFRQNFKKGNMNIQNYNSLIGIGINFDLQTSYQTSFPEQTIFYYISIFFKDAVNRYHDLGFELDIYIPSIKLAIEYDGSYYHKNNNKDIAKNKKCKKENITLIRIRENEIPLTNDCIYYLRKNMTNEELKNSIEFIFNFINATYNKNYKPNIDINRDTPIIMAQFKEYSDRIWNRYYDALEDYYCEFGNIDIPGNYKNKNGLKLGDWVMRQRQAYSQPNYTSKLSQTQIDKLNYLGMIWNKREYEFKIHMERLKLDLENQQISDETEKWLKRQIYLYNKEKLSKENFSELNTIYPNFLNHKFKSEQNWEYGYERAKEFYEKNNHLVISKSYKTEDGYNLGFWIAVQRNGYNHIGNFSITEEHIKKLNDIGMIWNSMIDAKFDYFLNVLSRYVKETNNDFPIKRNLIYNNYELGKMLIYYTKTKKEKCKIEAIKDIIGNVENLIKTKVEESFDDFIFYLKKYVKETNNKFPIERDFIYNDYKLGKMIVYYTKQNKEESKINVIKNITRNVDNLIKTKPEEKFEEFLFHLEKYAKTNNFLFIEKDLIYDSYELGKMFFYYTKQNKDESKIRRIEKIINYKE